MIDFVTWSRMVGLEIRSSILDHVYIRNSVKIEEIKHFTPCFGDQKLIIATLAIDKATIKTEMRRSWKDYSKDKLYNELSKIIWNSDTLSVQECWNEFESKLIAVVDTIVPILLN